MAESSRSRNPESPLGSQLHSPTIRQQLQDGDQAQKQGTPRTPRRLWSTRAPPHDYMFEDDPENHSGKKSIFLKIKDKAKKWKQVIAKKKNGHQENNSTAPPPWAVTLNEADEDDEPESHGAPMYESEKAPEGSQEPAPQSAPTVRFQIASNKPEEAHESIVTKKPEISHEANIASKELEKKEANDRNKTLNHVDVTTESNLPKDKLVHGIEVTEQSTGTNNAFAQRVTEMIGPTYSTVTSRMQESIPGCKIAAEQLWNKSVVLKESLMHKLAPQMEDRALCQAITEAVYARPNNTILGNDDASAGQKLREVFGSLFSKEEPQGPPIPVSTHPCTVKAVEQEGH